MAENILLPIGCDRNHNAIDRASQKAFIDELKEVINPYEKKNVSKEITGILKTISNEKLLDKNFVYLI